MKLSKQISSEYMLRLCYLPRDFPGGPVVKNPPSNAGDVSSIPGRGIKIPHATGQLSPCMATREKTAQSKEDPVQPKINEIR